MNKLLTKLCIFFLVLLTLFVSAGLFAVEKILITGELQSSKVQELVVPMSDDWRQRLDWILPEGTMVKQGQVVARFDGSSIANNLLTEEENLYNTYSQIKKIEIEQSIKVIDEAITLKNAQAKYKKAKLAFETPDVYNSELKTEQNRNQYLQAKQELQTAQKKYNKTIFDKKSKIAQKQMEVDKQKITLQKYQRDLQGMEIKAEITGPLIYAYEKYSGKKIAEGDSLSATSKFAGIQDTNNFVVIGWVHEIDIDKVKKTAPVTIKFDAYPENSIQGVVSSVSVTPEELNHWSRSSFHKVIVNIDNSQLPATTPGMSALIEVQSPSAEVTE